MIGSFLSYGPPKWGQKIPNFFPEKVAGNKLDSTEIGLT
jgi:hypothetical protein